MSGPSLPGDARRQAIALVLATRARTGSGTTRDPSLEVIDFVYFVLELRCYDPGGPVVVLRRELWNELRRRVESLFGTRISGPREVAEALGQEDFGYGSVNVRREHWNELKWQIGEILGYETNRPKRDSHHDPAGPRPARPFRWLGR